MPSSESRAATLLEKTIFASRWLQAPLYLGLIVVQGIYVYQFFIELLHLVHVTFASHAANVDPAQDIEPATNIMLAVLGLIDVVMIANLLVMVIIGGYETFVSRLNLDNHPDQPEWLNHVNAGVLKVKLATALIGISAIHLLKTFIEVRIPRFNVSNEAVMWQVTIHLVFVVSAFALAWTDRVMLGGATAIKHAEH
jgi:uncharacterized protein (TIGR00645 family)